MSEKHFGSFEEFWPHYVRAHSNKTNRRLHFVGTTLGVACVAGGVLWRKPLLLAAGPILGYGISWIGHFVFEKNVPLTFTNPLYSARADWLMWGKIANGTMDAEVERYVAEKAAEVAPAETASANGAVVDVTAN